MPETYKELNKYFKVKFLYNIHIKDYQNQNEKWLKGKFETKDRIQK